MRIRFSSFSVIITITAIIHGKTVNVYVGLGREKESLRDLHRSVRERGVVIVDRGGRWHRSIIGSRGRVRGGGGIYETVAKSSVAVEVVAFSKSRACCIGWAVGW